ncbi:MAG: elongation factor P [Deltaproteobacteria bacterium]|nr:elongation factor P [Deltaproteobacteria bacterium]
MINATQIRAGMTILFNGSPYKVLSVTHVTPGKGRAHMQTKIRNMETGIAIENRFRSDEKVERARLDTKEMEYLYSEESEHHFMDTENYEQIVISDDLLGDGKFYLTPNVKFLIEFFKDKPVGATPPKVVELKITDTPPNMKGATASSSYKPATLETGLSIGVPPFVEAGEVIRVDTVEGKYLERAKQ